MPIPSRFDPADPRLPERLWRWAVRWLSMGGEHTLHVGQRRKITQVNMAALIAMAATWVASVLFWVHGNAALALARGSTCPLSACTRWCGGSTVKASLILRVGHWC